MVGDNSRVCRYLCAHICFGYLSFNRSRICENSTVLDFADDTLGSRPFDVTLEHRSRSVFYSGAVL